MEWFLGHAPRISAVGWHWENFERLGVPVFGRWAGRCGIPVPSDLVLSLGPNPKQFYSKSEDCLLKLRRR